MTRRFLLLGALASLIPWPRGSVAVPLRDVIENVPFERGVFTVKIPYVGHDLAEAVTGLRRRA